MGAAARGAVAGQSRSGGGGSPFPGLGLLPNRHGAGFALAGTLVLVAVAALLGRLLLERRRRRRLMSY
jgi:hypothetical protein